MCAPLKRNKWESGNAGAIIQLVDAENYSNTNASPGSNHKHCDAAKTEAPPGLENVWNLYAEDFGMPPGSQSCCVSQWRQGGDDELSHPQALALRHRFGFCFVVILVVDGVGLARAKLSYLYLETRIKISKTVHTAKTIVKGVATEP